MAAYKQSVVAQGSGSATTQAVTLGAVTVGDMLVCLAEWDNDATFTCTVSDSVNGAWTALGTPLRSWIGSHSCQAFYFVGTAAGSPVVTMTISGSGATLTIRAAEYDTFTSVESFAYGVGNSGAGTTWNTPSVTPVSTTDGVVILGRGQVVPSAVSGPFTLEAAATTTFVADDMPAVATSPTAPTLTVSAGGWNAGIVSMVLAPPPPPANLIPIPAPHTRFGPF